MNLSDEFTVFWSHYPRRVAKLAAVKAFRNARRTASLEELLAGVDRYRRHKPKWQDWAHPATFLSQGRWLDEYDEPRARSDADWFEECKVIHDGSCGLDRSRHALRKQCDAVRAEKT